MSQWIAMFTSYYKGVKTDTVMMAASDPQVAIDESKRNLTESAYNHWTEVEDEELGRKILIRQALRSREADKPVTEYGWFWAVKPQVVGTYAGPQETAEDATAWLR